MGDPLREVVFMAIPIERCIDNLLKKIDIYSMGVAWGYLVHPKKCHPQNGWQRGNDKK